MNIAFFDAHRFEREIFDKTNQGFNHEIRYFDVRLDSTSAHLAQGFDAVCAFAHDKLDLATIRILAEEKVGLIALRSAGFNHVDLAAAAQFKIAVVRVPEYSPFAVAEHAMCLVLALNRKIHRAYARVKEQNFSLDGLVGFDLHGKTVGVIGTGRIGAAFVRIALGFGCEVLAYDIAPQADLARTAHFKYVELNELLISSHVISLHVPLTPRTHHLIDAQALDLMRPGAYLINTGRGALIDTKALIHHLKSERLGAAGLDVYEEEENIFFRDLSEHILQDDQLARLMTFPNVLITSHQAFLTHEALANIARTTLQNVTDFGAGRELVNQVKFSAK